MMVIDNSLYILLFSELAKFLVENSRHEVYYVFCNSEKKSMIRITNENLREYKELVDLYDKKEVTGGMFFMKKELGSVEVLSDKRGIKINSYYKDYNWLNFKEL